jgi:hypothetical protein
VIDIQEIIERLASAQISINFSKLLKNICEKNHFFRIIFSKFVFDYVDTSLGIPATTAGTTTSSTAGTTTTGTTSFTTGSETSTPSTGTVHSFDFIKLGKMSQSFENIIFEFSTARISTV